ncbi:hypothetical protein [Shewanella psychrotolerans]|uniref:hypothetical protein n=1 Tax=Shewanella psychrotolerans TaxID=2864206 RepID=UPI001C660497|nr:hypothetical protein [Shewanella psychrotolerans]QYK02779.1 hypothetical protein K0I62_07520 [Shewanella psychrotolerans]
MKKLFVLLISLSVAYVLIPVSVNGSLYVVTNSSAVVPMPMTELKVYPLKAFRTALYEKQNYVNEHCVALPNKVEVERAYLLNGPDKDNAKESFERIVACETQTLLNGIDIPAIETLITSKEGEFTFQMPRFDSVVIMGSAKRQLAFTDESYQWIKVVNAGHGMSADIELNNTDLVGNLDVRNIQL